ncbi:sugar transporter [Luteimonas deserti]|uniref:Sugar transporter n=1 Tax=Luteimonas deserti TaxID=2752306 RepID=A0A7Z0QPU8_9GAMM|nr:sugar transporter [Luteimonas deserti]NYZ61530.1 sugar transporter [Luteimonas deserti]
MSTSSSRPLRRLRVVGVLALIWNLIGVAAFVMQLALPAEALQAMPPERRAIYEATPAWLYLFYALATFGGALGAAALLLRRRWAAPVFAIALAALLLQIVAGYATTPAWAIGGLASLGFPVLLVGVAAALLVFAQRMAARGVLR